MHSLMVETFGRIEKQLGWKERVDNLKQWEEGDIPVNSRWKDRPVKVNERNTLVERRGSVVVSTSAWHAAGRGSIPGPGMFHY